MTEPEKPSPDGKASPAASPKPAPPTLVPTLPPEIGGAPGPEPTRYGDWSHKGRCTDF